MKSYASLILLVSFHLSLSGCSIWAAAHAPSPVEYKSVHAGDSKVKVVSVLGSPKMSLSTASGTTDHFEFTDGHHPATKARILFYLAGDIFSVGLGELIFWPLEELALDGSFGLADVDFDRNNDVQKIVVKGRSGDLWYADPKPAGK
jgi:hypothetical protein